MLACIAKWLLFNLLYLETKWKDEDLRKRFFFLFSLSSQNRLPSVTDQTASYAVRWWIHEWTIHLRNKRQLLARRTCYAVSFSFIVFILKNCFSLFEYLFKSSLRNLTSKFLNSPNIMFYAWLPSWLTLHIVRLAVCFGGIWMYNFKWFVCRVKYSTAWFCFVLFHSNGNDF